MIDLAIVGTGGGMPMPNRFLASALLNIKGHKILIDCGEGTQVSLRKIGWGFKSIDIICITHGHGDHIVGLPGLLATIGNSGRTDPITIIGPKGITAIVKGLRVIVPYLPYELNIIEAEQNINVELNIKSHLIIKTLELDHSAPCLGYSFYIKRQRKFNLEKAIKNNVPKELWNMLQKGKTIIHNEMVYEPNQVLGDERRGIKITYITDTRPTNELYDFVNHSDLLISEGTYGSDEDINKAIKNKHLTFREAAKIAKDGNVKELILTHFTPAMNNPVDYLENAKDIFDDTVIAYDGMQKVISFED